MTDRTTEAESTHCVWQRLPNTEMYSDGQFINFPCARAKRSCDGEVGQSVRDFFIYPDECPRCQKPVKFIPLEKTA